MVNFSSFDEIFSYCFSLKRQTLWACIEIAQVCSKCQENLRTNGRCKEQMIDYKIRRKPGVIFGWFSLLNIKINSKVWVWKSPVYKVFQELLLSVFDLRLKTRGCNDKSWDSLASYSLKSFCLIFFLLLFLKNQKLFVLNQKLFFFLWQVS